VVEARLVYGGLDRLDDGFHGDAFPNSISFFATGPVPVVAQPSDKHLRAV
jgi:hypothetical protein